VRTGVIVYLAGGDVAGFGADLCEQVEKLGINADRVEIVSSCSGHFDVMDAWWSLTSKGMGRIICMLAEMSANGSLKLTGRELRLCG